MRGVDPELPKEMLPVGDRPAIQWAAREGVSAGIEKIIIIINRKKEIIRRYFEERGVREGSYPLAAGEMEVIVKRCAVSFLYQERPLGEWDAVSLAEGVAGTRPVAVIYPDNIYIPAPGALELLMRVFQKYGNNVTALAKVGREYARGLGNSGRVDITPLKEGIFRVKRFHPKGSGPFIPRMEGELRSCGISIYLPRLFAHIERRKIFVEKGEEFTDVSVRNLIIEEEGVLGCLLPGALFDVGNPTGYAQCLSYIENL